MKIVGMLRVDITSVSNTASDSAQPQASAISLSVTKIASTSTKSVIPTSMTLSLPSNWNATTLTPPPVSGCSADCTFTVPVEVAGSWTRCDDYNGIYIAGQVKHIVDKLKNTTITTTIYAGKITYFFNGTSTTAEASDIMSNGSFAYSRTDVNEAGTVTDVHEMYVYTSRLKHHARY
jgi:hypothetical protein